MAWQVLAIWLIVGSTFVWFIRDEKNRRSQVLSAQALRFANAPHYRRPAPAEAAVTVTVTVTAPEPARRSIKSADRAFLERYLRA